MQVAILVFDGVSATEAVGPHDVFRRAAGVDCRFVARRSGPYSVHGSPGVVVADRSFSDVLEPDVVFVPGGFGFRRLASDGELLWWLELVAREADVVAGVSTGSLLLAAAGALDGVEATTHWLVQSALAPFGAIPHNGPIVERDRVITASGGVSAVEVAYRIIARALGSDVAADLRQRAAEEGQRDVEPLPHHLARFRARRPSPTRPRPEPELEPYVLD